MGRYMRDTSAKIDFSPAHAGQRLVRAVRARPKLAIAVGVGLIATLALASRKAAKVIPGGVALRRLASRVTGSGSA